MGHWWVSDLFQAGEYALLASWVFWVLFSITLHELAHGWAALRQGDRTPIERGHMTPNPVVHMGPVSLIMFAIVGIAWGMMPVNPSRFKDGRIGRVLVSAAGPVMNLGLAVAALTLAALWGVYGPKQQPLHDNLSLFLVTGGWLNVLLAGLNMLPVPPLDGSTVLAGLSFRFYRLVHHPQATMVGFFIIIAIFITPLSGVLFGGAMTVSGWYMDWLVGVLPSGS